MISKRKFKFHLGSRTIQFKQEERVFLLKWAKTLKGSTEIEKRIIKRFLLRLMGETIYLPLYPSKECPHCERTVAGDTRYDSHVHACLLRAKAAKMQPKIDPAVWEMLGGRL